MYFQNVSLTFIVKCYHEYFFSTPNKIWTLKMDCISSQALFHAEKANVQGYEAIRQASLRLSKWNLAVISDECRSCRACTAQHYRKLTFIFRKRLKLSDMNESVFKLQYVVARELYQFYRSTVNQRWRTPCFFEFQC
jgi:hypothetical protein